MKKPEIAKQIARKAGLSQAEAADRLDGLVRKILADVRSGKTASLPGLGKFHTGPAGEMVFEPSAQQAPEKGHRRG